MAAQAQYPIYKQLGPPYAQNQDDACSNLSEHEYPFLEHFIEYQKQLWPVVEITGQLIDGVATMVSCFTLPDASQQNILFSSAGKMYYVNVQVPNAATLTEITVAGGSTAITADGANTNPWSIAFVNGSLYFAHNGTGVLRVWAGGATYADVAAPGSGYHNAVKYKPYYLAAQNNRLIILGDAAAAVGTKYDVVGSTTTNAADFTSFGSFYTQLLDTPDVITGGSILASKLIVYKKDSIIVGTPTGDATAPYSFERYQQSTAQSIGCFAPYSLVNDGGFRDIFVSRYGVVIFDGAGFKFVGGGQDAAIMGLMQLATGSGSITPAQATLGSIYVQGTAYPPNTATLSTGTNKPGRFYFLLAQPEGGLTATAWLMNADTLQWSTLSGSIYAVGSLYFANTDLLAGVAPGSQKYLVLGTARIGLPTLAQSSVALASSQIAPSLRIGSGPAIYGDNSEKQKTVQRIGLELVSIVGANQTVFSVTPKVYISADNNAMDASTVTGSAQVAYRATNPVPITSVWAWINIEQTCRAPIVELDYPSDTTARFWPRISRMVVQYQLGDDA